MTRAIQMSLLLPLWLLFGCVNLTSLKCDLGGTGPDCPTTTFVPLKCSELVASQFSWTLRGFVERDILNPDVRDQRELTAIMHVGDVKALNVSAGTTQTSEDCSAKATSVEWSVSNPVVARLDFTENPRTASLVALQPGDTVVAAILHFQDGTPPMRVLPWSFTNVGSGSVTVVRVVP
jgi:hypothetical protein